MGKPVFAGYLIKGIDETRCPKEYKLREGEEGNSYTVYVHLEPFKTKESDIWGLSPDVDSELRKFWGEFFNKHTLDMITQFKDPPFSGVEYSESGELAVHGTTLEKIQKDQAETYRKRRASCLELLVCHANDVMQQEFNRRYRFRANAAEIKFQEDRQTRR